ncbi:hypothetical protein [Phyllobacterium sp. SB3]|uniref:hypothetical protein n=1 Tax=Phyllobacterium sp. SB3 TaxID=3156073 RepID=UPI0032AF79B7
MSAIDKFDISNIKYDPERSTVMLNLKADFDGRLGIVWGSVPVESPVGLNEQDAFALANERLADILEALAAHIRSTQ